MDSIRLQDLGLVGAVDGIGFPVIGAMFTQTGGGMSEGSRSPAACPRRKSRRRSSTSPIRATPTPIKPGSSGATTSSAIPRYHGSHGQYTFQRAADGLPSTNGQNLGGGAVMPYASFLLGMVNNAFVSNQTDPNWRKPAVSVFLQDTWRVKMR